MDVKKKLKEVARGFDLKFSFKGKFKYLILTKREIIIKNFLGRCPDPSMIKYGNQIKSKIPKGLLKYLKSKDYDSEVKSEQGCVIRKSDMKYELGFSSKIDDKKVRREVEKLYQKIRQKFGTSERLTLIWNPTRKDLKYFDEILLHEFIHELMEYNGIRPKSWEWNEGLVTYLTSFALNRYKKCEEKPKLKNKNPMTTIYTQYTSKVAVLLKDAKTSKERKKLILTISKNH